MDLNTDLNDKSQNSNIVPNISKLRLIALEVAEKHGFIDVESLADGGPRTFAVAPRNEFFYRACTETKATLGAIGRLMNADHTSVHYGAARYALYHDLPPPRGTWPAKVKRTKKSSYPKTFEEARLAMRKRDTLTVRYTEDLRSIAIMRGKAKRGSANLLTLLKRHHGPLVG